MLSGFASVLATKSCLTEAIFFLVFKVNSYLFKGFDVMTSERFWGKDVDCLVFLACKVVIFCFLGPAGVLWCIYLPPI